jgi:nucleoside diphosphate kinase
MKSRTGGLLARLLSRSDLELVAAQMLAPDQEFTERYADSLDQSVGARNPKAAKLLSDYVRTNFAPAKNGKKKRVLMLLFKGEDACRKLFSIVGHLIPEPIEVGNITGETIRDTYADLLFDPNGDLRYFEPAVLTAPDPVSAAEKMRIFADFAKKQSNIVENIVRESDPGERTLAIIKPDNWRVPSSKPGNIIDMFSRTGLRIIGCKIHRMSVEDALAFYGPVKPVLRRNLAPRIAERARKLLESELKIDLSDSQVIDGLTELVGIRYADHEFGNIIEFMSGRRPENCPPETRDEQGGAKCMVLIYEGVDAIRKIREVLGPTDPTKAPGGTVRADFGHNIMVNTAHASDSKESVEREMKIVKMKENRLSSIICDYLNNQ